MSKLDYLVGSKHGRLTVIRRGPRELVECLCDCGSTKLIRGYALLSGNTKSCGCLLRETQTAKMTKHGGCYEPLYQVWAGMIARCSNPKHKSYTYYGGRGIKVCKDWHDYTNFRAWSQGKYTEGLEIDRLNNNGDYCPTNCKWVTDKENSKNKSNNVKVHINGETLLLNDARLKYTPHLSLSAIRGRYYRGWDLDKVFELG